MNEQASEHHPHVHMLLIYLSISSMWASKILYILLSHKTKRLTFVSFFYSASTVDKPSFWIKMKFWSGHLSYFLYLFHHTISMINLRLSGVEWFSILENVRINSAKSSTESNESISKSMNSWYSFWNEWGVWHKNITTNTPNSHFCCWASGPFMPSNKLNETHFIYFYWLSHFFSPHKFYIFLHFNAIHFN